jgi:hypothetical protein
MLFGDGTYSKRDFDLTYLTFTQSPSVGRTVRVPSSIHTKDHPALKERKREREDDVSSTLLYTKKIL